MIQLWLLPDKKGEHSGNKIYQQAVGEVKSNGEQIKTRTLGRVTNEL